MRVKMEIYTQTVCHVNVQNAMLIVANMMWTAAEKNTRNNNNNRKIATIVKQSHAYFI